MAQATLLKDGNGYPSNIYSVANITSQTTTLIKTGEGFLHSITFNHPVSGGTCELDDALTQTTPKIGTITTPASPIPVTLIYDIWFKTGLSVTTGSQNQDISISFI